MQSKLPPRHESGVGFALDGSTLIAVWHVEFKAKGRDPGTFHQFLVKHPARPYLVLMIERNGDAAVAGFSHGEPKSDEDAFRQIDEDHKAGAHRWERHRVVCLRVDSADPDVIKRKIEGFMGVRMVDLNACPCGKCSPRGAA